MKKLAALALACIALPTMAMAADGVKSEKLLNDYGRYAVVYTSDEERVYVDTQTLERDPMSAGALPVIRGTLYAEVYKDPLTYPDYGNYKMIKYVLKYETAVGADQVGNKLQYRIQNNLQGIYDEDGKVLPLVPVKEDPADEADDIYMALYRLSK